MPYQGVHAPDELVAFGRKLKEEAAPSLSSLNAALTFLGVDSDQARQALYDETGIREEVTEEDALPGTSARVLGLFSDLDIEEEESAEFSKRRANGDRGTTSTFRVLMILKSVKR